MPRNDDPVWRRLAGYSVGPDDADFTFEARLARENGWDAAFAARVLKEYRRFCYLAVSAGHPVTPSDAVDQAWHLHLTYSRDYWNRFCPDVLGKPLHHGPTAGGQAEHDRYYRQYADTLASYEAAFGLPPADIWPDAHRRLRQDPLARRVDPAKYLIVPRRAAYTALALALLAVICLSVLAMR